MTSPAEDMEGIHIPTDQGTVRTIQRPRWPVLIMGWLGTLKGFVRNQRGFSYRSAAINMREESCIFAARVYTKSLRRTGQSGQVNQKGKANT